MKYQLTTKVIFISANVILRLH